MNRDKAVKELKKLTWEELDWLEQQIRKEKSVNSKGGKVFRVDGTQDAVHEAEAKRALTDFFDDVLAKHHPGY